MQWQFFEVLTHSSASSLLNALLAKSSLQVSKVWRDLVWRLFVKVGLQSDGSKQAWSLQQIPAGR